jgi:hypothetical protein
MSNDTYAFTPVAPLPQLVAKFALTRFMGGMASKPQNFTSAYLTNSQITQTTQTLAASGTYTLGNLNALFISTNEPLTVTVTNTNSTTATISVAQTLFIDGSYTAATITNPGTVAATLQLVYATP